MKPSREVLAEALSHLTDAARARHSSSSHSNFRDRAILAKPEGRYYKQRAAILQRLERFSDAQGDLARAR
jgi:hypothetical protein